MLFETNKIYKAIVIGPSDSTDGKYKVFIPSLMPADKSFKNIVAKNRATPYGKWMDPKTNTVQSIGTYIPLQSGMQVELLFETQSILSAKIVNFWYDDIPLDKEDQESFYLVTKTKNGSVIYSDDKRGITQILHNRGKTSVLLMDDKISLSVNETSDISNNNLSNIEITENAIIFKVGNNMMQLDETGFHIKAGENVFDMTKKDTSFITENLAIKATKSIEAQGNRIYVNGLEQLDLKSTTLRASGGQHLSITGNVINIAAQLNATISSTNSINFRSTVHTTSESSTIVNKALGLLYNYGASACYNGLTTVLNGTTTAINGTTIFEDSQIIRGMGAGASMATTLSGVAVATSLGLKAADIGLVTAFHFGDPFSGMAGNMMTETLPGTAEGCPNQMPNIALVPTMDYINSSIKYINKGFASGNIGTVDYINSLSGSLFKKVHLPIKNSI